MLENYELVQKGFRVLHPLMAGYIGQEFSRVYKTTGGRKFWTRLVTSMICQHPETTAN